MIYRHSFPVCSSHVAPSSECWWN